MTKFNPVFSVIVTIVCTSNLSRVPPPWPRPQPLPCLGRALDPQASALGSLVKRGDVFDAADLRAGGATLEPLHPG